MKKQRAIILDTGPLVALVDEDDHSHETCKRALKKLPGATSVYTVTSVLSEAFYLLPNDKQTVDTVFDNLSLLGCKLVTMEPQDLLTAKDLMKKYANLPMDFADCEIFIAAEKLSIDTIFTLDKRDFSVYKPKHARNFCIIPD